jgi:hypothetical protein
MRLMFCPQCGQQQVSDEVRFCSRCGFQLGVVTGLLATGGAQIPNALHTVGDAGAESARRKGVRHGVTMFFIGAILTPVLAIVLGPGPPDGFPGLLIPLAAVILFLGGFLRMIYALIFEEGPLRKRKSAEMLAPSVPTYAPPQFGPTAHGALPPGQSIPARSFMSPHGSTSEIPQPPSVTESATKLLDDQRDTRTR